MDQQVTDICRQSDILLSCVRSLQQISVSDNVSTIQYHPQSIEMGMSTVANPVSYADYRGYQSNFGTEIELTAALEAAIDQGQEYVWSLYSYRSVSKAIPEVVIETPEDAEPETEAEIANKRNEINRKIVDILRGGMAQMKDVKSFVTEAVGIFHRCLTHLAQSSATESAAAEGLFMLLIRLIDLVIKLDNLKDVKASILNDFARYKRALGAKLSPENVEEIKLLQSFLSSFDVKKSKNFIFSTLRDEVKRVRGHEDVLADVLEHALTYLETGLFLTSEERFRLIRVLPYLILLIDGNDDEPKSYNVFTAKKLKSLPLAQKYIKQNPVVPLCGDMTLTLVYVLQTTRHFDSTATGPAWGLNMTASSEPKIAAEHSLLTHWKAIRQTHSEVTVKLTTTINRLRLYPFEKVLTEVSEEVAAAAYDIVLSCMKALADWNTKLQMMISWKYTHPCSLQRVSELSPNNVAGEGVEYEQVIRYNLSKEEIYVLVDVIALIKSLSSQLLAAEAVLAPLVRFHIHHTIQQLVQGDILPLLHRVDKRNKSAQLSILLQIRSLAADWLNNTDKGEDYKQYTRKQGAHKAVHTPRVVSASATQLHLLRMFVYSLYDESSLLRARSGWLSKTDLEKEDVRIMENFYLTSYSFSYLLAYADTLRSVSDLSDLWFKEFYLELTKCIQFPIEMSIPWLLTESVISNKIGDKSLPTVEEILFTLDIYNDAAHRALYVISQQYLYDEIEAEANLVLDQVVFILSDEVYGHYKNVVSASLIDQTLKQKLEEIKGEVHLYVPNRRLHIPLSQRNFQLLGRSINLNFLIGQHITGKFTKDIETCLKKFESADCRGLPELVASLTILRETHAILSTMVELDAFDGMVGEVDESVSASTIRGRIFTHVVKSLVGDIIPNFCYNVYTHRFVKAPIPLRAIEYEKAPKTNALHALFGEAAFKAHDMTLRLSRNFFGKPHLEALLSLSAYVDVALLVTALLDHFKIKLEDVIAYMEALHDGIPPCKLPQFKYKAGGVYGYFLGKLSAILEYDDLKPEVFQGFRELGNIIALVKDLSDLLDVHDQFRFIGVASVLGVSPDTNDNPVAPITPLGGILARLQQDLSVKTIDSLPNNTANAPNAAAPTTALDQLLPSVHHRSYTSALTISQLPEIGEKVVFALSSALHARSLFLHFLGKIKEATFQFNLNQDWGFRTNADGSLDLETGKSFSRLFTALNFLYCVTDSASISGRRPPDDEGDEGGDDVIVPDDDEFGHGFPIAGTLLVHLLQQRDLFELSDFSYFVLNVNAHDKRVYVNDESVGLVDNDLQAETNRFVITATAQRTLHAELFAYFEMQSLALSNSATTTQAKSSTIGTSSGVKYVKLHPPADV